MVGIAMVENREVLRMVHEGAAQRIVGYHASGGLSREGQVYAATDDDGRLLLGGAVVEGVIVAELAERDPRRADLLSKAHRVLAGLYVAQEAEGNGIGRALVDVAASQAFSEGARYLDGFVDDRNHSADFYRSTGAQVLPHNADLPARPPANVTQTNPRDDLSGHWFYWDLWKYFEGRATCVHCAALLAYSPAEDRLACPRCRPAKDVHEADG